MAKVRRFHHRKDDQPYLKLVPRMRADHYELSKHPRTADEQRRVDSIIRNRTAMVLAARRRWLMLLMGCHPAQLKQEKA